VVATQPAGSVQATAFTTQPVVHIRVNGNTDATDNSTVVSVSIATGTGAQRRAAHRHHHGHRERRCGHLLQPRHRPAGH
jgi:hypothetical protein